MDSDKRKTKLWKCEEDQILRNLVKQYGSKRWTMISNELNKAFGIKRTPKQCRDRWFNNLCQHGKAAPFTDSDITIIIEYLNKYGNQWSKIAKHLPGQTENSIKNYMYATVRRNLRKFNRNKLETEKIVFNSFTILNNPEIRKILTANKRVKKAEFDKMFLSSEALKIANYGAIRKEEVIENNIKFEEASELYECFLVNEENFVWKTEPENLSSDIVSYSSLENEYLGKLPDYSPMVDFEYH
ncbi:hypothetical protein SteCoe_15800 [Stentor coeruleus]|uniref:Myb-like DNA-binding domain containing protein n=1 Tax=Stentor coeruleus TaxID=5963 RepID=A0A1R2C2R9_9CILI|nr:hypothetical protein SteCoe_15800 [Stentor coeruleus]